MPFDLQLLPPITRGVILASADDLLPLNALRVGRNIRTDRLDGVITPRPGGALITAAAISAARPLTRWLTRLHSTVLDRSFSQQSNGVTSELFRMDGSWQLPTSIASWASHVRLTDAVMVDGRDVPWKYVVGPGLLKKDSGTGLTNIGLPTPAVAPAHASLGIRHRLPLATMDGISSIYNIGVISAAADTTFVQQGTHSLKTVVNANSFGEVRIHFGNGFLYANGTHNGGVGSLSLTDTVKNFISLGVARGARIRNVTDGSEGHVTRVTANTLFFDGGLFGGAGNNFDPGDAYRLYYNLDTLQVEVAGGFDNSAVGNKTDRVIDPTQNFVEAGIVPGMTLWNTANGSSGTITAIITTTSPNDTLLCSGGLSGSTESDFDPGDGFVVVNDLVKDDDYIHLWVLVDFPDRVEFLQIAFDRDTDNPDDAFRTNYYQVRIAGTELNQGHGTWTELLIPKSRFTKMGNGHDWRTIRLVQLSIQTTIDGPVSIYYDDLSLLGGYGIQGEIEYTAFYRNALTNSRGSPPKAIAFDGTETILYTYRVEADRHAVQLSFGAIAASADPQVTQICLVRRGGTLTEPRLVARLPIGTVSYTDRKSDLELVNAEILETDNDPPPADTTGVVGPGAMNRLFYFKGNRIYPSKAWEEEENRAENVPSEAYFTIGGGSETVVNGIVQDVTPFFYTASATYQVQGLGRNELGQDVFLPLLVDGSRGLAARKGLTSGDGQIFLVSQDGIYAQRGLQFTNLTTHLEPFFQNVTVHGQRPIDQSALSDCELEWVSDPQERHLLIFTYKEAVTGEWKQLIQKKNQETGLYTDSFFDNYTGAQVLSVYHDPQDRNTFAGLITGHISEIERHDLTTDAGQGIAIALQTVADTQQRPRHEKQYESIVVESHTNGETLSATVLYDRATSQSALGSMGSSSEIGQSILRTNSTALRRNIAVGLSGTVSTLVKIYRLGWHVKIEPESLTWFDSGPLALPTIQTAQRLWFDIDAPAAVTVTMYRDGTAQAPLTLAATTGQRSVPLLLPLGQEARTFRITASSPTPFRLHRLVMVFILGKPEALTSFDTGPIALPHEQTLQRLWFDIEAPSPLTIKVYDDGIEQSNLTLPATSGQQPVSVLAPANLSGRTFRVTGQSLTAFFLWRLALHFILGKPEPLTYAQTDEQTFDHIHACKRVSLDIESAETITLTLYRNGIAQSPIIVAATGVRKRVPVWLPAGQHARGFYATLSSTRAFHLWSVSFLLKPLGVPEGYQESAVYQGGQQPSAQEVEVYKGGQQASQQELEVYRAA